MAKPQWTYPSNTNLATISERIQHTIPILVFDNTSVNQRKEKTEVQNFVNQVDSSKLPVFTDDKFFWVKSKGLAQTTWLGQPSGYSRYSPSAKNYVFKFPRDQITINGEHTTVIPRLRTNTPTDGFFGVAVDGVPFKSVNSKRQIRMNGRTYTENSYIYPSQEEIDSVNYIIGPNRYPSHYFVDGSGVVGPDKAFYYQSDPRLLYTKTSERHSPIIGYAFDGNPIYGPYGFNPNYQGTWNEFHIKSDSLYLENDQIWVPCRVIDYRNGRYTVIGTSDTSNSDFQTTVDSKYVRPASDYSNGIMRYSYKRDDVVKHNGKYYICTENLLPFLPLLFGNYNPPPDQDTTHWREALNSDIFKVMRTSYRITEVQRANDTLPDGTYIEDFVYDFTLGDLDSHNGRYTITPEYPGGTYAYFVTVDPYDVNLPRYPYIVGPTYHHEPLLPNGSGPFPGDISLKLISGTLPRGMRIEDLSITGVPFEVSTLKKYRFVLRASNADGFSDRTYSVTVDGPDIPLWGTPAGSLEIGATGKRSTITIKLLKNDATAGASFLRLNSIFHLQVDSVVTCEMYPNAFLPDTKITKIDPINKIIFLSKPIQSVIPRLYYPPTPFFKYNAYSVDHSYGQQNFLKVGSIAHFLIGDIIKDLANNRYISPGTTITHIDTEHKILTLSNPLVQTVSEGIQFVVSHPENTEIKCNFIFQHTNLYVLDNQYVNYRLNAVDSDTAAGVVLKYYIPPRGGQLPLGLNLSEDGIISGFTKALLAHEQQEGNGNYDMQLYDKYAYDYGVKPYNGFDSFLYDTTIYDYWTNVVTPRKINRHYEFIVRVSDGIQYSDRKFRIFVVGDDYFRADTTILQVGNSVYTSDVSAIRAPYWLSPSYLGKRRANNYITTLLEVYNNPTLSGTLGYVLDPVNDDGSPSILPSGMKLDQISGAIYGDVPYQPAVTKTYKFTVRAIRYDSNNPIYSHAKTVVSQSLKGDYTIYLDTITDLEVNSLVTQPAGSLFITPGSIITSVDPKTNSITINTPILATIPIGTKFLFSYLVSTAKTFTMDILGEVESTIKFITPGALGTIAANFTSQLSVVATTTVKKAILNYTLMGGKLPPGLTLFNDGTIQGKVTQYSKGMYRSHWKPETSYVKGDIIRYHEKYYHAIYDNMDMSFDQSNWEIHTFTNLGLTSFDKITLSVDQHDTSIDREYKFMVLAQDQFQLSAVTKVFDIKVTTPNNLLYSNIYVKPFLSSAKRQELSNFFSNTDIFTLNMIYRLSDPEFGIQTQMKMLLYAGIETVEAGKYAAALNRSSRKRYKFGKVKKAIAKKPGTNEVVYEAIYIEMIDDYENSSGSIPELISIKDKNKPQTVNQGQRDVWDRHPANDKEEDLFWSRKDTLPAIWMQDKILTVDQTGQYVSDFNKSTIFGNSTTNIRNKISDIGETERNYLPLWMRTPQTFSGVSQGFTKAVVLCYVNPGYGDTVINNIKNLGIDFKNIDYTIDRVIIDSVKNELGDKYIAFGAREIING